MIERSLSIPTRDEYEAGYDRFISDPAQIVHQRENLKRSLPGSPEEEITFLLNLVFRAYWTGKFLVDQIASQIYEELERYDFKLGYAGFSNVFATGVARAVFLVDGEKVSNIGELSVETINTQLVELIGLINLNFFVHWYRIQKKYRVQQENERQYQARLNYTIYMAEQSMAHEVGHLMQFIQASRNQRKAPRLIEYAQSSEGLNIFNSDANQNFSDLSAYENSPYEKRANLWKNLFKKNYQF